MQIQYITDNKGHKTNVVVPYKEWEHLMQEIQKQKMLLGLKKAVSEIKVMKSGKKKLRSMEELLDEL